MRIQFSKVFETYLNERTLIVDPVVKVVLFMLPVLISIWSPGGIKHISKLCKYNITSLNQNTNVAFEIDAIPSTDGLSRRSWDDEHSARASIPPSESKQDLHKLQDMKAIVLHAPC